MPGAGINPSVLGALGIPIPSLRSQETSLRKVLLKSVDKSLLSTQVAGPFVHLPGDANSPEEPVAD